MAVWRGRCHAFAMSKAARKERTARWMRHYQALPDRQRGIIMLGLLASALTGVVSYLALYVALVRSARRSWRQRRLGPARAVRAGVDPMLVGAIVFHIVWRIALAHVVKAADDGRGQEWLARVDRRLSERARADEHPR